MKQRFIRILFYLFTLFIIKPVVGNSMADSLLKILDENINDSVRAEINSMIGHEYIYSHPNKSLSYYYKALALSKEKNFKTIEAKSLNAMAVVFDVKSEMDSAKKYYNKSIKVYEILHDTLSIGQIYNNMATTVYNNNNDIINCYLKALTIIRKYKDASTESYILFNLGRIYFYEEDYEKALEYFYLAKEANIKINVTKDPYLDHAIGHCYLEFNMLDHSLSSFYKALEGFKGTGNKVSEYTCYISLDNIFMAKKEYDSVAVYLKKLKYLIDEPYAKPFTVLVDFSSYYLAVDSIKKAGECISRAQNKIKESEDYNYKLIYWLNKSNYYRKIKFPQKSLQTLSIINEDSLKSISYKIKLFDEYSKVYYQLGYTSKAFQYLQKVMQWKDSLNTQSHRQMIIEKEITSKFEKEKREQEAILKQQNLETQLKLSKKKKMNLVLGLGISFILVITIIILFSLQRKRKDNKILQKQKEDIQQKEELATTLFRELNHRVRNNLQMISGLFTIQYHNTENENVKEALTKASGRIDCLIVLHQNMYKVDYALTPGTKEFLADLCQKVVITAGLEEQVNLQMQFDDANCNVSQLTHIGLIINELLTNAIKYGVDLDRCDNNIAVSFLKNENFYTLSVLNSTNEKLKILNHENSSHFGLGLIETIASQYHGEVTSDFIDKGKVSVKLFI